MSLLESRLLKRHQQGNIRKLGPVRTLIDLASNDYLGLSRCKTLSSLFLKELETMESLGSTGSRLLTGNSQYIEDLEEKIAHFHGYETGFLFSCGYMANLGLLSGWVSSEDCVFFDAHIHASTRDGIHLSRATAFAFRHNDLQHLEQKLKQQLNKGKKIICVESIYSTDGSQAPLQDLCYLAQQYDAYLHVDEAHAVGVVGPEGKGLCAELQLTSLVPILTITFGKALGTHGAIILCSHSIKEYLINFAKTCIYTTALPYYGLAAINCSYALFPSLEAKRAHIQKLISIFRDMNPNSSETQIQSILIPGNYKILKVAEHVYTQGFDVRPLLSPTVRRGQERLRICLHAFNTCEEIHELVTVIKRFKRMKIHLQGAQNFASVQSVEKGRE